MSDSTPDAETLLRRLDEAMERIAQLEEKLASRDARIAELEHQLNQNSSNSHRPPSSDDPFEDEDTDDGEVTLDFGDNCDQGAQSGHEGHHRELADADEVDEFVEIKPDECSCCGASLGGEDIAPWRHQVWDIEITNILTEYRMHRLECSGCGHSQRAELPEDVPNSSFGDRLAGWVGWLTGRFDLSKRDLEQLVEEGFEIPISVGSVCALERRAQHALAPAWREAVDELDDARVVWVDETSWFEGNDRGWIWVGVGDDDTEITVFRIADSRSRDALEQLVAADFDGIVTSDRYGASMCRDPKDRQICWQHLMRDFRGLAARDGPGHQEAEHLLSIAWLLFWTRDRIRRQKESDEDLKQTVETTWKPAVKQILKRGKARPDAPGIFKNLWERKDALWTFVDYPTVEPTNNRAERAIRPAVIKRKLSFGTESTDGSRFIERMLTVCESLRRQGRAVLDFIVDSLVAKRAGQSPPSLARPG